MAIPLLKAPLTSTSLWRRASTLGCLSMLASTASIRARTAVTSAWKPDTSSFSGERRRTPTGEASAAYLLAKNSPGERRRSPLVRRAGEPPRADGVDAAGTANELAMTCASGGDDVKLWFSIRSRVDLVEGAAFLAVDVLPLDASCVEDKIVGYFQELNSLLKKAALS